MSGKEHDREMKEVLKRRDQPVWMARRVRMGSRRVCGRSTWWQGLAVS